MAIAQSEILAFNMLTGEALVDGRLNQLFQDRQTGTGLDYGWVVAQNNNATLTWTGPKFWFDFDLAGATLAAAVADGNTARAASYSYPSLTVPASFSSPVDAASGLVLPATLTPGQKCVVCIRRDTTGAGAAFPENNRFWLVGSSPA